MMYDIQQIRSDFPILSRQVYGKPLVYLDNGATTQKPKVVVDALTEEYYSVNANVHRGVHFLSQQATELHESSRETVRHFIGARSSSEIIFTRGTTESINLVAACFGEAFMHEGDEVIVTEMEHHSNIVPWQLLQARKGIRIRVVPITDTGELRLDAFEQLFNERTRIVSVTHVSNVLGTINPIREMIRTAHAHDVPVLVDGAQSTPHFAIDVQALDCDFFAFSGHKTYGPTGIGVLYGKEEWLDRLPPYMGGGEMIKNVSFEHTTFNELPFKFEAGTPDYVASTGLARALDYLTALGMDNIATHEQELTRYATERLSSIEGMRLIGQAAHKDAVVSFLVGDIHPLDMGTLLDRLGIAVRTGHHCAEPLMHRLGIEGMGGYMIKMLKELFYANTKTKLGALLVKKQLGGMKKKMDARTYGGAPILGISKPVIKAHGNSDAIAIRNAIRQAIRFVEYGVNDEIINRLSELSATAEEPGSTEKGL
ncbi:MAG: SufS family cysteine desulfurase [Eubacteriales bacterium]